MREMPQQTLSDLPKEILIHIVSLLHPLAILPFSLTCRDCYGLSKYFLEKHRDLNRRYKTVHDSKSLSVPTLLRQLSHDPGLSWHIRRLVVLYDRESFDIQDGNSFEMHDDTTGVDNRYEIEARQSVLEEKFLQTEHVPFYTQKGIGSFNDSFPELSPEALDTLLASRAPLLTTDERSSWIAQVQEGQDATLKALLAFSLPRLQTLVFTAYNDWDAPSLVKINEYIRKLSLGRMKGLETPAWYNSIETVRLNHWIENRHPHDQLNVNLRQIAIFLSLPNIKKFYTGIGGYGDDHDYQWEFEPRSSPVAFLDLGMQVFGSSEQFVELMKGIKRLRGISINSSTQHMDGTVGILESLFSSSLEILQVGSIGGNRSPNLRHFEKLRLLELDMVDLPPREKHVRVLAQYVPSSLEILRIRGCTDVSPDDFTMELQGLVERKKNKTDFLSLRGICFGRFTTTAPGWTDEMPMEGSTFKNTVTKGWLNPKFKSSLDRLKRVCKETGVKISCDESWFHFEEDRRWRIRHGVEPECAACGPSTYPVFGKGIDRSGLPCDFTWEE